METLNQVRRRIAKHEHEDLSEADTKRVIIEPLLELLGWDIRGIEEVKNEYRAKSSDNPVDYGIFLDKKPAFLLEAKALGVNIDDRKCITQTVSYASTCGTEWAVVTNGRDWAIYNALAPVDAERKLFRKFSIDQDGVEEHLSLLQKSSMGEAKIKRAWDMEHAVKQVLQAMRDLLVARNRTLVGLVKRNTSGLANKEIEGALLQLEISMPALPQSAVKSTPTPPPQIARKAGRRRELKAPERPASSGSAISRLQEFFDRKWQTDPGWFERHHKSPSITKKTRRFFGKSATDIYTNGNIPVPPKRVASSDWFFDGNLSSQSIESRLRALSKLT